MTRLRLLLLVAGAGTLLAGVPAQGAVRASPEPTPSGAAATEGRAVQLLSAASRAARTRTYSGTQYVSTWRANVASSSIADVRHTPVGGSVVDVRPTADRGAEAAVTMATDLDPRLLGLLADHYVLSMAPDASYAGRTARVVEARRPGASEVAGRFWIDADSSLLLRREAFDQSGRLLRSSAFASLVVAPAVAESVASPDDDGKLGSSDIARLRADGWQVPASLAGDLELYDARVRTHGGERVLHLAYSDGLSTLSLFAQRGRLGSNRMAGFAREKVGRASVWVRTSSPERVVWGGGGRVFTLLSDAPPEQVRSAVRVLPHEKAPSNGLLARLGRGLARLASWLNPFS